MNTIPIAYNNVSARVNTNTKALYRTNVKNEYDSRNIQTTSFKGASVQKKSLFLLAFAGFLNLLGMSRTSTPEKEKGYENTSLIKDLRKEFVKSRSDGQKREDNQIIQLNKAIIKSRPELKNFIMGNSSDVKAAVIDEKRLVYKLPKDQYVVQTKKNDKVIVYEKYSSRGVLTAEIIADAYMESDNILKLEYSNYEENDDGTISRKVKAEGYTAKINDSESIVVVHKNGSPKQYRMYGEDKYEATQKIDKDGNLLDERGTYSKLYSHCCSKNESLYEKDQEFITVRYQDEYARIIVPSKRYLILNISNDSSEDDKFRTHKDYTYLDGTPIFTETVKSAGTYLAYSK